MPKKKKIEKNVVPGPWCPSCLQQKEGKGGIMIPAKKVTMTRRSNDTLECPKCYTWIQTNNQMSKEERKNSLKAQLAALEAE